MAGRGRIGTIAAYGPDASLATKLVAAVLPDDRAVQPIAMETWTITEGDVRQDRAIASQVMAFFAMHGVRKSVSPDRIVGCPHQEGIDYPMGRVCPECPFWAGIDRFTHEPIRPPVATLSPEQVVEQLSIAGPEAPHAALVSADAHRAVLVEPLLEIIDRGLADPYDTTIDDGVRFAYAFYLLAKWRETRAYPYVIRWLSLPGEAAHAIGGDVVTQDGARILASVCDGDLEPIQGLIVNGRCEEFCRGVAVSALALLAAWREVPRPEVVNRLAWLEREGLEREPSQVWASLAAACADIAAVELFPALRRDYDEGLIDPGFIGASELDEVERRDPAAVLEATRERNAPIDSVAEATAWWGERKRAPHAWPGDPVRVQKIGRNEPCPCGSGRKYKKCCGQ